MLVLWKTRPETLCFFVGNWWERRVPQLPPMKMQPRPAMLQARPGPTICHGILSRSWHRYIKRYTPGTPTKQFKMNVWWNKYFLCKDLESSNWHNHLKLLKFIHTTYIISRSESASISSLHFQCFVFNLHGFCVSRDELTQQGPSFVGYGSQSPEWAS